MGHVFRVWMFKLGHILRVHGFDGKYIQSLSILWNIHLFFFGFDGTYIEGLDVHGTHIQGLDVQVVRRLSAAERFTVDMRMSASFQDEAASGCRPLSNLML